MQNAQGNTLINLQPSCRGNASPSSPSADGLPGAWGQHAPDVSLYSCGLHILADISTPAMVEGLAGANKGLVAGRMHPCLALLWGSPVLAGPSSYLKLISSQSTFSSFPWVPLPIKSMSGARPHLLLASPSPVSSIPGNTPHTILLDPHPEPNTCFLGQNPLLNHARLTLLLRGAVASRLSCPFCCDRLLWLLCTGVKCHPAVFSSCNGLEVSEGPHQSIVL